MLTPRRRPFQLLLSVAGGVGVLTGIVIRADTGVLLYGCRAPFAAAVATGVAVSIAASYSSVHSTEPDGTERPGPTHRSPSPSPRRSSRAARYRAGSRPPSTAAPNWRG